MDNNSVLRRIRYLFDYNDHQMIDLFEHGGMKVSRSEVSDWLKKEKDPAYKTLHDLQLAVFLNGFIVEKRGKKEGAPPLIPEKRLNNNIILRKLKIALNLKTEEMQAIFAAANSPISQHELSAFFRNPKHPKYRSCKDQYLRNFMNGLQGYIPPNSQ